MDQVVVLHVLVLLFHCPVFALSNKYSISNNKNEYMRDKMDRPFRMNKVNLLWQKARKRLGPKLLDELYGDLKLHDAEEGKLKKLQAEDKDPFGDKEAFVRKSFIGIMHKYNLHEGSDILAQNHKRENDVTYPDKPSKMKDFNLNMDKKLAKLWKKAQMSGFSDDEMEQLRLEFMHHQDRIDEFNQLQDEARNYEDISKNSIEQLKYSGRSWKEIEESKAQIKMKHKHIKASYQNLEAKTAQNIGKLEFTEPRVYELWASAKSSNMTAQELESFKEELKHFETKIQKHEYMKEMAQLNGADYHKKDKYDEDNEWGKKASDYGRKIKKIHTELRTRLERAGSPHTEL